MKNFNEWMDEHGLTAEDAAELFRKSAGTIRNWRSLGVPETQVPWVRKVMLEHDAKSAEAARDRIWLEVTDDQLRAYDAAARLQDLYWKDWAIHVLDEAARDDQTLSYDTLDPVEPLRVAEHPNGSLSEKTCA